MGLQPTSFAGIETCIQLGVFGILAKTDKPQSVADLATITGAEPELLSWSSWYKHSYWMDADHMHAGRIMKHLATMGVFVETGLDQYTRNGLTTTLALKRYSDAFPCM